jgi:deoxyribose-phosphate aldolase
MTELNPQDLDNLAEAVTQRVQARLKADQDAHQAPEGCGFSPVAASDKMTPPAQAPEAAQMARFIDHTLLAPQASREQIEALCKEALEHRFFSVCVNSSNVRLAASLLQGSDTKVCAVVGFPLGAATATTKAFEAREAVRCGATEIDMVMNIGALRSRDYALVTEDIRQVVQAVPGTPVKVILETGLLDQDQKMIACALAKAAKAAFVKTSTGFGPGGATAQDIALMRSVVGPELGVKASGGVRTYGDAVSMLQAGANRIGASKSVAIVTNSAASGEGY